MSFSDSDSGLLMATFRSALKKARGLAAAGDLNGVLEDLLTLWRRRRAPQLAAVIDRISTHLTRPIAGRTLKERLAHWTTLEAKQRAADLGTLLGAMHEGPSTEKRRQLERLLVWPDDPRIARAVIDLRLWHQTAGVQVLKQHADPRTLEASEILELADYSPRSGAAKLVLGLRERFGTVTPSLDDEETVELDELDALVAERCGRTEAELLAEVYAQPQEDQSRLVLADLLMERGDPRGELIQLQCLAAREGLTPAQQRRAAALARKHRTACYGALAPIVARGELERGFLRRVRLKKADLPLLQQLATAPDWATVEELDVADVWREHQVSIAAPQLPRLRALVGLRAEAVIALMRSVKAPLRLQTFGCFLNDHTHEMVARDPLLARTPHLPSLTRLALGGAPRPDEQAWLFGGSPLGQQLRAVEVPYPGWASIWIRLAEASSGPLEELVMREDAGCEFERYGWTLTLSRDAAGRFSVAAASHDGQRRVNRLSAPYERLAEDLMQLPTDALSSLRFDACRGVPADGRAALEAALTRQSRLAAVKLPR